MTYTFETFKVFEQSEELLRVADNRELVAKNILMSQDLLMSTNFQRKNLVQKRK